MYIFIPSHVIRKTWLGIYILDRYVRYKIFVECFVKKNPEMVKYSIYKSFKNNIRVI